MVYDVSSGRTYDVMMFESLTVVIQDRIRHWSPVFLQCAISSTPTGSWWSIVGIGEIKISGLYSTQGDAYFRSVYMATEAVSETRRENWLQNLLNPDTIHTAADRNCLLTWGGGVISNHAQGLSFLFENWPVVAVHPRSLTVADIHKTKVLNSTVRRPVFMAAVY